MMCPRVLSLALLLALRAADSLEVRSALGADAVLQCTAKFQAGVQYEAVRWYKVGEPPSPRLSGLLVRDLLNGTTRWYSGAEREVELLAGSLSLLLPDVTCADGGVYSCHLAAPVGQQNQEGEALLTLPECPDRAAEFLVKDAYMVAVATAVLIFALVIFRMSYVSLRSILKDRKKVAKKETLLDAPLKPLDKKDLMSIYTLGPAPSKKPTLKHVCV